MHPLLHLIATKPQLLADHAQAYGELLATEAVSLSTAWKRRAMLMAIALCSLGVACVLAGVALMLSALMPAAAPQALVVLIMVPLLPLALCVGCLLAVRSQRDGPTLENVRRQFKADVAMLREASSV
jgi:hypothetical protein